MFINSLMRFAFLLCLSHKGADRAGSLLELRQNGKWQSPRFLICLFPTQLLFLFAKWNGALGLREGLKPDLNAT